MKAIYDLDSQAYLVEVIPSGSGKSYRILIEDKTLDVQVLQAREGHLELLIDGKRVTAYVSSDNARRWVTINGQTFVLTKSSGARKNRASHAHAAGELTAPMPGQVRAVNVGEGDAVTRGQTLLLLEAMKMEIRIQASHDGVVRKLLVKQGQTVERDQVLVEIEEN